MDQKPANEVLEEIILPENLLPLGSVLSEGITPLEVSMVLAKVFRVQHAEVALLKLEGGLLKFIFPEHLRTTGVDSDFQQSDCGPYRVEQERQRSSTTLRASSTPASSKRSSRSVWKRMTHHHRPLLPFRS